MKGRGVTAVLAIAAGGTLIALGMGHQDWVIRLGLAGFILGGLIASLLLPAALLAVLLRVIKLRDRTGYFALARPGRLHAFPPAAFGNSSGGRNVS